AVEQAAHREGYFVSIVSVQSLDAPSIAGAVDRLRAQGVEGIVVIAPQEGGAQALGDLPADVPIVAVEAGPAANVIPIATVDQVAGAAAATQHLLDLGHTTVWHLAGPSDWLEAQARIAGWRSTLEAAGAPVPAPLLGDWSPRSGHEMAREIVGRS